MQSFTTLCILHILVVQRRSFIIAYCSSDKLILYFIAVMPDFAQVYSFLGSVFDSNASGHMERLKMMDPINIETVFLLLRL